MKHWQSVRAVLLPAAIAFIMLTLLMGLQSQARYKVGAVAAGDSLSQSGVKRCRTRGLLMSLPLHLKISRADYDEGALTLDIKLSDPRKRPPRYMRISPA